MKNKSSNHGLSYFFRQQIHGEHSSDNLLELAKPELEGTEIEAANIMRWEDAGGPVFETGNPLPQLASQAMDMDSCKSYGKPRQEQVQPVIQ